MVTDEQLAAYLAGEMEPDECAAFEAELLADEGARGELLSQRQISAGLHALLGDDHERLASSILATTRELPDEAIGHFVVAQKPQSRRRASRHTTPWWMWPLAAAALLVAGLFSAKLLSPQGGAPPANVARLTRAVAAAWEGEARAPGQALAPGWLRLRAGVAQIEFARGARVVLEGPAELRIVSDNEGFLRSGKLHAFVPETAHGFTIRGEGFSAVDRGTEFGVIAGGRPEVHVLSGTVAVRGETERLLAKAEGVRFSAGKMEAIPANAALFLSEENVTRMEASAALSAHPAALVHYDFRANGGTLANLVAGHDIAASVTGCEAVEGRWPGKGALDFTSPDAHVRFTVPGEMQSLTLLAWVRVDAMPNAENALLMSDAEMPGDVHWYFRDDGAVGFGVIAPGGRWRWVNSPKVLNPKNRGAWLFVATTFDGATGAVTHYFNGRRVAGEILAGVRMVHLRTVEIGNWGVTPGAPLRVTSISTGEKGYIRNLHGRVDEFAILSAALPAGEIQRLFENGRPAPDAAPASPK